ncbi:hypothetical protein [Pelistega suis]|uniref:Uncharacterized protein n=1 Tax=Pelistega suis TaxID=1631957 RepID=A0A849P7B1_9BURK|nr:hypothetical protein [Pelistega suis]NOL51893.1 hypothetical protein [Pelistega suis]
MSDGAISQTTVASADAEVGIATVTNGARSIAIGQNVTVSNVRSAVAIGTDVQAIRFSDGHQKGVTVIGEKAIIRNVSIGTTVGGVVNALDKDLSAGVAGAMVGFVLLG